MMPSCACFVQAEIGADNAFAYDLNYLKLANGVALRQFARFRRNRASSVVGTIIETDVDYAGDHLLQINSRLAIGTSKNA